MEQATLPAPPRVLRADPTDNYGARWLRSVGKQLSPFGEEVADFLNDLFDGIYHVERDVLRVDWTNPYHICLNLRGHDLSTYDGSLLTMLVIGAHDRAIRVQLEGIAPHTTQILFHPRQRDGDRIFQRHPTIQEAVERWSKLR